jgi:ParB/RepB/Spo0J family partition protein
MKGAFKTVTLSQLRRHSIRQRQRSREQLIALAESWLSLPVHPIVVRPPTGDPPMYDVADGNSRLDGLELLGKQEAEVFVTDAALTDDELDDIGFATAYHREGLTCYEQALIVIRKRKAGKANQDIAKTLAINPGWASKLFSLDSCVSEVQAAARDGKIGANEWHTISQSQPTDQLAALRQFLNGESRETVQRAIRKPKEARVRTARIRCPLPSGVNVQVSGADICLEDAIESLSEAVKLMKYAQAKGLNIKTAMNLWKDVAAN